WLRSAASVHHRIECHPDILSGNQGRLSYPPSVAQTERGRRGYCLSWHCGSQVLHKSEISCRVRHQTKGSHSAGRYFPPAPNHLNQFQYHFDPAPCFDIAPTLFFG